jgi:lipopolysaccharide export system permease protein
MRILDKYVLKEMIVPTLAGMLVVFVLMLGNTMYYLVTSLIRVHAGFADAASYLALKTPSFVWIILPSGALFGCALAVTRLARDSEITMMRMAGTSVRRILLPMFIVGILLSGFHYWVQERVSPWAETKSKKILERIFSAPQTPPIQANVVFNVDNYWFYVQRVDRSGRNVRLYQVMVYELNPGESFPTIITADSAVQQGNVWLLKNGISRTMDRSGFTEYEVKFQEAKLDLRRTGAVFPDTQKSTEEMTAAELAEQIRVFGSSNQEVRDAWRTDYHFKLSIPFTCFLIMLCVAPLCLRYGRTGSFMGVLIGILVLAVYWNVIVFGKVLGVTGHVPPIVAGWSEVGIFLAAGVILMWKAE